MPRNGSGSYSLPQPSFVPGTTISSTAVNSDFNDIATALTGSISADGQTPITAPLKGDAGIITAPAWTFAGDTASGMYQPNTGEVGLVAGGLFGLKASSVSFTATGAVPAAGGTGYVVGDTIALGGGTALRPVILTVASLTGSAVASVTLTDGGLYTTTPTNPVAQSTSSGSGTGATFTVTYTAADAIADLTGHALWTLLGASSYMATAMQQINGTALAAYIGSTALAAAIQASLPVVMPQVRLSLSSLVPIINGDVVGATAIYAMPYMGNLIPIWTGSFFQCRAFTQRTLTLNAAHAANTICDVFVYWDGSAVQIGSGPAWATSTAGSSARGSGAASTQLASLNGLYVNAVDISLRNGVTLTAVSANKATYIGSFYVDAVAGQVTCHVSVGQNRKFGVWNAYNRANIVLQVTDPAANWAYTGGLRASNGSPASWASNSFNASSGVACNGLTVLDGLAEEMVFISNNQNVRSVNGNMVSHTPNLTIGMNSTTAASGVIGSNASNVSGGASGAMISNMVAQYTSPPTLGLTTVVSLETGDASTPTFYGTSTFMNLQALWQG